MMRCAGLTGDGETLRESDDVGRSGVGLCEGKSRQEIGKWWEVRYCPDLSALSEIHPTYVT